MFTRYKIHSYFKFISEIIKTKTKLLISTEKNVYIIGGWGEIFLFIVILSKSLRNYFGSIKDFAFEMFNVKQHTQQSS